jgi:hypothetical protein
MTCRSDISSRENLAVCPIEGRDAGRSEAATAVPEGDEAHCDGPSPFQCRPRTSSALEAACCSA